MERLIVLDFGGQYAHLIARRIRDLGVFAEVMPAETTKEEIIKIPNIKGIILSGGAKSVYEKNSPIIDKQIFDLKIPILGICYGHQLIASLVGGVVAGAESGEYGLTELISKGKSEILQGLSKKEKVWMNHKDVVCKLPTLFLSSASTKHSKVAVFENKKDKIYGVQFHPEVSHTEGGKVIFENFIFGICKEKNPGK